MTNGDQQPPAREGIRTLTDESRHHALAGLVTALAGTRGRAEKRRVQRAAVIHLRARTKARRERGA